MTADERISIFWLPVGACASVPRYDPLGIRQMFTESGEGPKGEALFALTTFADGTTLCNPAWLLEAPAQPKPQAQAWQTQLLAAVAEALSNSPQ